LDKITWWHFQGTSKEVIWSEFFLNYMHGKKSAIWAIFQKGLEWLCPLSAALKTHHSIRKVILFWVPMNI
jgi:hypothetical protein